MLVEVLQSRAKIQLSLKGGNEQKSFHSMGWRWPMADSYCFHQESCQFCLSLVMEQEKETKYES